MRKFALAVLDTSDKVIDRYNLDFVTEPQGLGFTLNLSTIKTDVEDAITKVVQAKNVIKFNVNQVFNSYQKSNTLVLFIQKYSTPQYRMILEYSVDSLVKYCEGRVTSLTKSEMNQYKNLIQSLDFTQITPFFIKRENTIVIRPSAVGKKYPFKYPYSYGVSVVENNNIDNPYILETPVIATIKGGINNPTISLQDVESETTYNTVKFGNFYLEADEQLVINSAQKKIVKINADGTQEDFTPEVDPAFDTFLRAKSGKSILLVNYADAEDGFELTGGWREYTL